MQYSPCVFLKIVIYFFCTLFHNFFCNGHEENLYFYPIYTACAFGVFACGFGKRERRGNSGANHSTDGGRDVSAYRNKRARNERAHGGRHRRAHGRHHDTLADNRVIRHHSDSAFVFRFLKGESGVENKVKT